MLSAKHVINDVVLVSETRIGCTPATIAPDMYYQVQVSVVYVCVSQ